MKLFASHQPWTERDWGNAGFKDAMECRKARYGGSDMCEDVLRQYIYGYMEGQEVMKRTSPCARLEPTKSFTWEETVYRIPGLIPVEPIAIFLSLVIIATLILICALWSFIFHALTEVYHMKWQ